MSEMWACKEPEATDCGTQGELHAWPVVLLPRFAAVVIDGVWARASSIRMCLGRTKEDYLPKG